MMKSKIFLIPILLLFLISVAYAEIKIDMGPGLEICYDSVSNCKVPIDIEKIPKEQNLYFKISLINDGSIGWICFNHWRYTLEYQHEDEKSKVEGTNNMYNPDNKDDSIKYCIPPNERFTFYLPFEYYNTMNEDIRVHQWTVTPKVSLEKIKCYEDFTFEKEIRCTDNSGTDVNMEGNRIRFESVKELPTTKPSLTNFLKWFTKGYNSIYGILGFLAVLITVILGIKKLTSK